MTQSEQEIRVPAPSKAGWPDRYFAVIFTAQRSLSGDDIYDMTADRMVLLAQRQPGFLGVESVRGDDGIGITVSYWVDRCLLYTSPSPRDKRQSRMPSSA